MGAGDNGENLSRTARKPKTDSIAGPSLARDERQYEDTSHAIPLNPPLSERSVGRAINPQQRTENQGPRVGSSTVSAGPNKDTAGNSRSMTVPADPKASGAPAAETGGASLRFGPRLWDKAYKSLKDDKKEGNLVSKFQIILFKHLRQGESANPPPGGDNNVENVIAQEEVQMKQVLPVDLDVLEMIKQALGAGSERIKTSRKIFEKFGDLFGCFEFFKKILDASINNVPQAALPWAVVSCSLEVCWRFPH